MSVKNYIKFPLIFGLIAGIMSFLFLLLLNNVLNINPLGGKKETAFIFFIFAMIWAVYLTRKSNEGGIQFRSAYGVCFLLTIIGALVSLVLLHLFLVYISPDSLANYIHTATIELVNNKTQIMANGISKTDYASALENLKKTTVKSILIDDFIKKIFISIIPSILISLYFRRRFIYKNSNLKK